MKPKKVILAILLISLLAGSMLACTACTSLRTAWAVRNFAKEAGTTVAKSVPPAKGDYLSDELAQRLAVGPAFTDRLRELYEPTGYAFVFIKNQNITPKHQQLNTRLAKLWDEGIDTKAYDLETVKQYEADLAASLKLLDSLVGTALDEMEVSTLTEAMTEAEVSDLTPTGILNFAGAPANDGKFPNLQKMLAQAETAAADRDEAIVELEVRDAQNFFRMVRDMGMPDTQWTALWEKAQGDLGAVIKETIPVNPHYAKLVKELERFRQLAKADPQPPTFHKKNHAKLGRKGKHVLAYQHRLAFEGYWNGPFNGEFDEAFEQAVKKYQLDRQVVTDGKIEYRTIERFNVPMSERVKQLKLALKKMRHSPTRGGDYFLRVNIGAQEVEAYTDGGAKIARRHRIIVGNRLKKNHTPLFSDEVEMIVFNPPWLVPQRIIKEEMLPAFTEDEEYFKKKGYRAKIVTDKDGNFEKIAAVTQPPGRGNALGVVKILFPNKHSVYLHDTPTKYLFDRALRTYSHGCMRMQDPVEMAKFLLQKDKNEALAEVDEMLESRATKTVYLKNKVPIHLVYVTVSTNEEGKAVFFTDPYNIDVEAMEAMSPE